MFPSPSLLVPHRAVCFASPLDPTTSFNAIGAHGLHQRRSRGVPTSLGVNGAAGREEARFEVDRDKAREALQQLDQQLESLAQQEALPKKNTRPPPPPAFDPILERDLITGRQTEEMPEMSVSNLTYAAVALVLLTVMNNIIFNVFIKPSVDGIEQISEAKRVPLIDPTEQLVAPQSVD